MKGVKSDASSEARWGTCKCTAFAVLPVSQGKTFTEMAMVKKNILYLPGLNYTNWHTIPSLLAKL